MRVLILDDDPITGAVLMAVVASYDASAEQITDSAALGEVVRSGWDLLFLDLVMPGLDGIDVLREHAADATTLPPLVLVSGLDAGILETAVHFARQLGYRVTIGDPRPAFVEAPRFARVAEVVSGGHETQHRSS